MRRGFSGRSLPSPGKDILAHGCYLLLGAIIFWSTTYLYDYSALISKIFRSSSSVSCSELSFEDWLKRPECSGVERKD